MGWGQEVKFLNQARLYKVILYYGGRVAPVRCKTHHSSNPFVAGLSYDP